MAKNPEAVINFLLGQMMKEDRSINPVVARKVLGELLMKSKRKDIRDALNAKEV